MEKTKRILDEETKRALRGFTPFSTKVTVEFTPAIFEIETIKPEYRPKFSVRALTKEEKTQLQAAYSGLPNDTQQVTSQMWVEISEKTKPLFLGCVKGWRDYFDSGTGEEIPYSEEAKTNLSGWVVMEIIGFIRKISELTPPEVLSLK